MCVTSSLLFFLVSLVHLRQTEGDDRIKKYFRVMCLHWYLSCILTVLWPPWMPKIAHPASIDLMSKNLNWTTMNGRASKIILWHPCMHAVAHNMWIAQTKNWEIWSLSPHPSHNKHALFVVVHPLDLSGNESLVSKHQSPVSAIINL